MQKCITTEVAGMTCHLIYNNQAVFEIAEAFPDQEDPLDAISGKEREQYEATVRVFLILAQQAELVRGYYGYPQTQLPEQETIIRIADVGDWLKMKNAIYAAVVLGTEHHVEPSEDIDVTLMEFQNEKNAESP
ncbi:MAG: hypothetical protein K2K90_05225 [Lachnospiraceae bacterium]|nr:hypothetical protein [Lachnospiraceae bacterium]